MDEWEITIQVRRCTYPHAWQFQVATDNGTSFGGEIAVTAKIMLYGTITMWSDQPLELPPPQSLFL